MSSTSLKKRTSLGGGGGNAALSSRVPASGGLVATALGFGGSVPDEVARKVKIDFFSLCAPMLSPLFFPFRSFSMERASRSPKKNDRRPRGASDRDSRGGEVRHDDRRRKREPTNALIESTEKR